MSIFVDESGDFGPFDSHAPFYIFTLVFHDQSVDIQSQIEKVADKLQAMGKSPSHCFHVGPIIRREQDYYFDSIQERRRMLNVLVAFARSVDISYMTFMVEKKQTSDAIQLTLALSKQLSHFLQQNTAFFCGFERVVVYYDNGQVELNKILASVFGSTLFNVEFKRVIPAQYRLFQVADLLCTTELIVQKESRHILSHSESGFFGSERDMKKNYIKPLLSKKFKV